MREEIADQWVKALRSGKYKQTERRLKTDNGFCCLGVLCDISGISEWIVNPEDDESYCYLSRDGFLPPAVQTWAGMKSHDGRPEDDSVSLADINDSGGTFEQIAAVIEQNWEKL